MENRKLIKCLPDFMQKFLEIQEITNTEQIQVDILRKSVERVLNNAFINDCDEYGIQKYENLLDIKPSASDTLESRKSRVLFRWNDRIPYTIRILINKLNALCGVNNYTIVNRQEDYFLQINTQLGLYGQTEELENLLEHMLPENIFYTSENTLDCISSGTIYVAIGMCNVSLFKVSNDSIYTIRSDGKGYIGTAVTIGENIQLSNDYQSNVTATGKFFAGGATVSVAEINTTSDSNENYEARGDITVCGGISATGKTDVSNDFKNEISAIGSAAFGGGTVEVSFMEIKQK